MEFAYDGGGLGKGGDVTLYYDGKEVGKGRVEATQPIIFSADETTDVGYESGTRRHARLHRRDEPVQRQDQLGPDRPRRRRPHHLIDPEDTVRVAMALAVGIGGTMTITDPNNVVRAGSRRLHRRRVSRQQVQRRDRARRWTTSSTVGHRPLDLVLLQKDDNGTLEALELSDLDESEAGSCARTETELAMLLSEDDVLAVADAIEPGTTAAVLVWENLWAVPFGTAVRHSGGQLVAGGRIPIQALAAAIEADEEEEGD